MGERTEIYSNGQLVSVVDTRDIESEKASRVAAWRESFSFAIAAAYPPHRQLNAALGILDDAEKSRLVAGIEYLRAAYAAHKQAISAAETLPELDAIYDPDCAAMLATAESL